jgi:hypothetical protein
MSPRAVYVYAVARQLPDGALDDVRGIGGAPVGAVAHGGLVAVVGSVPLEQFGAEALKANLEDLRWLEAVARAHHSVIDAVAGHTTVLPMRLATVYHDEERVGDVLRRGEAAFAAALDRVAGRLEWGAKVYTDPGRLVDPEPAPPAPTAAAGPGRDYLRRRQRQRQARERSWEQAAEVGKQVDAALAPLAEDVRYHRVQDQALSGRPGENVLNAAYLVRKDRSEAFLARARELLGDRPGVHVELTGPWVPYSFVLPDEPSHEQAGPA